MRRSTLQHSLLGRWWLITAVLAVQAIGANLKPETIAAWNAYIESANESLQMRVNRGGSFLWTLEDVRRAASIRNGEIVIAPARGQTPTRVPGGLIHHWIGALLLRGANIDDVLAVTRDYDRYSEFFRPSVIQSSLIARDGCYDTFSVLVLNKALFMRSALEADYDSENIRVDERRFYSITKSTRVQEIEGYGKPGEHRRPEGQGDGYVWKLCTIARLQELDDGVYYEIEAIELSRDIPAALRFIVDPIVRHVSRKALLASLGQTRKAVSDRVEKLKGAR